MERHFDAELNALNENILRMATMTEEAIHKSINALRSQNAALAAEIIKDDIRIDELELVIEQQGISLLALHQPMAIDLRFITTATKVNSELERIADLAVNISQCVLQLGTEPLIKPLVDIPRLADVARTMVREAIEAFVKRDTTLARKVIRTDQEADELRNRICEELINDYMAKDSRLAPRVIPLFLVARHLERICDHASYVAADIIYLIEAKVVKHHPEVL